MALTTWDAQWLHDLDWGTVPTWVSAFLTSGSLLLGFYILLRDRRKEERQEALAVICWLEQEDRELSTVKRSFQVRVANLSDRPVSAVHWVVRHDGGDGDDAEESGRQVQVGELAPFIRPDEEAARSIEVRTVGLKQILVTFQDADGAIWTRDLTPDIDGPQVHWRALTGGRRHRYLALRITREHLFVTTESKRKTLRRVR